MDQQKPASATPAPHHDASIRVRRASRRKSRRIRAWFAHALLWLVGRTAPLLYRSYMRFVLATSRTEERGVDMFHEMVRQHDGTVALIWHEEVLTTVYSFYHMGFRPSTLASKSDAGDVITRVLEPINYRVFRGGSYGRKTGQNSSVIEPMIEHMRNERNVVFGLTVDGPRGPRYHMKRGGVVIARECDKPLVLVRTWQRRALRWPSWDRMAIPLPFNVVTFDVKGPFFVPASARTPEGLDRFIAQLESELVDMAIASHEHFGQTPSEALVQRAAELAERDEKAAVS